MFKRSTPNQIQNSNFSGNKGMAAKPSGIGRGALQKPNTMYQAQSAPAQGAMNPVHNAQNKENNDLQDQPAGTFAE